MLTLLLDRKLSLQCRWAFYTDVVSAISNETVDKVYGTFKLESTPPDTNYGQHMDSEAVK